MPKLMPYDEMITRYRDLYFDLFQDAHIASRIRQKTHHFRHASLGSTGSIGFKLRLLGRVLRYGIFPGGPRRWWHFLRSVPWTSPSCLYLIINDWAMGLGIRSYCERHFLENTYFKDDTLQEPQKKLPLSLGNKQSKPTQP